MYVGCPGLHSVRTKASPACSLSVACYRSMLIQNEVQKALLIEWGTSYVFLKTPTLLLEASSKIVNLVVVGFTL